MSPLPRRIAAVTLTTAALLGLAGVATTASAASAYFVGTGPDAYQAAQSAWAQAHAAGYTSGQCDQDTEQAAPHYWRTVLTCLN